MRLDDYHRIARQVKEFVARGQAAQRAVDAEIARQAIRCAWCREHPGETHFDAKDGRPLFDLHHHAGRYVSAAESERISQDGP